MEVVWTGDKMQRRHACHCSGGHRRAEVLHARASRLHTMTSQSAAIECRTRVREMRADRESLRDEPSAVIRSSSVRDRSYGLSDCVAEAGVVPLAATAMLRTSIV